MQSRDRQSSSMVKHFRRDYLLISIIPLFLLCMVWLGGTLMAQKYLAELIARSIQDINQDADTQIRHLGEEIIRNKAADVAGQIEIYIRTHPGATTQDLQADPHLIQIASQRVGQTGYTCLYEAHSGIMRIHPNTRLKDTNMHLLAEALPSWWAVFHPTLRGAPGAGYYEWEEADGTIGEKYMAISPVAVSFHGKTLMVAATTYLKEFSEPILAMQTKAAEITYRYRQFVSRQGLIFDALAMGILLLTFGGVYLMGRRAAMRYILPIRTLGEAVGKLGDGNWEFRGQDEMLQREDEIGVLSQTFSRMSCRLRELITSLEQRLEEVDRAQIALKQSESHYRSLFDGLPIGLYQTTPQGRVIDANPALIRMMGYTDRNHFMGINAAELYIKPCDRTRWKSLLESAKGIFTSEVEMRRADGMVIWVENQSRVVHDENGQALYYEGSLKDVTARKLADLALLESEKNFRDLYAESKRAEEVYRSLIHSSADPILIYDLQGRTRYVSPVFTRVFGWTLEELEGKQIPFVPESEIKASLAIIQNLIEHGTPCQGFETKRLTKDGRLIQVSISGSRYDDHEGRPAGMLSIVRDISEKKKLQAQLQHAERMEAIGTLAGGIAHDFNNLMMGIQGNVSLMLSELDPGHPHFEKLKSIEKMIFSGSKLTKHLLGYARKGQYELKPVNLNGVVRETAETFSRTRREIKIHHELEAELSAVEADPAQIEQVLMNLYINAADAMPGGGDLTLRTLNTLHDQMTGRPYTPKHGRYVRLSVADTGIGMDPKTMERIFDPFFTTKEMGRGTGLGLASVYGIVKAHGGYIDVESELGRGSTFCIYLPASDRQVQEAPDRTARLSRGTGKILLVDDEQVVVEVGAQMLQRAGYSVISTTSGKDAIDLYRQGGHEIDLVILDMVMPDINGGVVYDRIKTIDPAVKVLLSSGYSIDGQAAEILKRGCQGFIQKPFSMEQLALKVKDTLSA
jgi:two-component system, cell cycle sensor histidine kinase and response regulator CckA